jgi:signal transduction histidine kinase
VAGGEDGGAGRLVGHGHLDRRGRRALSRALEQIVAGWPFAASLAAAVAARGLQAGRRRTALNEALHELRRPLQALALSFPTSTEPEPARIEWSVQMAAVALERLEREINGEAATVRPAPILFEPLVASAVGRWKARAALAGSSLGFRWHGGEAEVVGDRCDLAQALDNLIVNAIEHGGPAIFVEASACRGWLRVSVSDSGRASRPPSRLESPAELIARLSGRRRHGHGLRVVRKTAAAHGGDFRLHRAERGTEAVLELPLCGDEGEGAR